MSFSYPFNPFPFPEELACGEPYIHWPADRDILVTSNFDTAVAVPESWIDVGVERHAGLMNMTKEAYSLVMPRKKTIRCDKTKFVPVYRNKRFQTSSDKFIKPDTYYLEYLGAPSSHVPSHPCSDVTYHLLSFQYDGTVYHDHLLASYEGNDWLFQLYAGDTEKQYETPTRKPLAQSHVLNVCDRRGKHTRYNSGGGQTFKCDFEEYVEEPPAPCFGMRPKPTQSVVPAPVPTPSQVAGGGKGVSLGLAVGLPVGIVGALLLVGLLTHFAPRLQRRFRRDGAIRL